MYRYDNHVKPKPDPYARRAGAKTARHAALSVSAWLMCAALTGAAVFSAVNAVGIRNTVKPDTLPPASVSEADVPVLRNSPRETTGGAENDAACPEAPAAVTARPEPVRPSLESAGIDCPVTESQKAKLAKTIWGEAGHLGDEQRAAVAWCALNRLDAGYMGAETLDDVLVPSQFHGYRESNDPNLSMDIVDDVISRWMDEKAGNPDSGRVLPREYLYFVGNGYENLYSVEYLSGIYWDWSLPSPYGN